MNPKNVIMNPKNDIMNPKNVIMNPKNVIITSKITHTYAVFDTPKYVLNII